MEQEIPFGAFDSELMHQEINIPEGFEATIEGDKIVLTRTESEDERTRKHLISLVKNWDKDGIASKYTSDPNDIKQILAWLEKQGKPIDEEKVLIGARKDIALSIMDFLDKNTLGMCLSNMECEDLEDAVVNSDWSKVYNYMKKKLEKQGEQKPAWNEEDINKHNGGIVMEDFNDGNGFYKVNLAYLNKEQVEQIEELVKRWNLQPKGNEDESIISDLLDYFDEDKCLKHEVNDIVKWLKTIKPQQKGWGDNEIKMFDNLITYLDGRKDLLEEIKRTYIDWLKSIKSRVKPKQEWSEEDQNALEDVREAVVHYWGGETQDILLYWLKSIKQKIKGE